MTANTWKQALEGKMPEDWAEEIDTFEGQIILKKQNKLDDKVFAETRLRRGTYGQRYDNGQRDDGIQVQTLTYPSGELLKGPETQPSGVSFDNTYNKPASSEPFAS